MYTIQAVNNQGEGLTSGRYRTRPEAEAVVTQLRATGRYITLKVILLSLNKSRNRKMGRLRRRRVPTRS